MPPTQRLSTVTTQLIARAQQPSADEPSLLKVLQTVLTIASSPALLHSDTTVSQLLLLCLTLQQNRSNTIKNTASATVQQFVALLLDAVAAEKASTFDKPPPPPPQPDVKLSPPTKDQLSSLSVAARCAFMAVQDLCLLANGEPALWLPGSGPLSIPFAFEVINRTLASHVPLFIHFEPFRFLLRERCTALVLKTAQQPERQEWAVALRLSHLTSTLLISYADMLRTESAILLSMLTKTASSESISIPQRVLALEACRVVTAHPKLLRSLFEKHDKRPGTSAVFTTFTSAISALLKSKTLNPSSSRADQIEAHFLTTHRAAASSRGATFNAALYSEVDGTALTSDHAAALAVECQVCIAGAIGVIGEPLRPTTEEGEITKASPTKDGGGGDSGSGAAAAVDRLRSGGGGTDADAGGGEKSEILIVREMVGACWKALLGALSLLMASFGREEGAGERSTHTPYTHNIHPSSHTLLPFTQAVLKCYQAFTQACGSLSLTQPRDAFLTSLCHYALPPRAKEGSSNNLIAGARAMFSPVDTAYEPLPHTRLSAKNVQALKAVFNIAHCMGGLLGASWSLVLDTFEQLDRIIAGSKTTASGGVRAVELATATGGPEATSNELSILSAALNNLFEGSVRLDDVAIAHFLTALSTSCFASLAHEATSRRGSPRNGSAAAQPPRLFALSKFVDTVLINLKRIRILWPLVTQFLLPVANHQTQRIRVLGMESLSKVLIASMRMHIADQAAAAKKDSGGPGRGSAHDAWDYASCSRLWRNYNADAPIERLRRRSSLRCTRC